MRIIAGTCGGLTLAVPKTLLRPTAERVREAVFSILTPKLQDAQVLDLFAGSGAYGLEALSRGAASADFVEAERAAAEVIRQNLAKTRLPGGRVLQQKVEVWLKSPAVTPYDLIFADPPYKKSPADKDWDAELLGTEALRHHLAHDGVFVLESFAKGTNPAANRSEWILADERRYGDSVLRFFTKND